MASYAIALSDREILRFGSAQVIGDLEPPLVSNFDPALGSDIGPNDPLSFDVTENNALAAVLVYVSYGSAKVTELVHDGTNFRYPYASFSTRAEIADGYRYTVRRGVGWPGSPSFVAHAVDFRGNVNV